MHKRANKQEIETWWLMVGLYIVFMVPLTLFWLWSRKWNQGSSKPQFNIGSRGRVPDLKQSPGRLRENGWSFFVSPQWEYLLSIVSKCKANQVIGLGRANGIIWMLLKTLDGSSSCQKIFYYHLSEAKLTPQLMILRLKGMGGVVDMLHISRLQCCSN